MKRLEWDKSLSVEVEEIDEDHRRLVELFNLLGEAVEAGESWEYVDALLDELIACTIWHFKHEERMMLKYGYDGLEEHRQEHQALVDSALELQRRFRRPGGVLDADDILFLEHWLTGHIYGADMRMGAYLCEAM